MINCLICNLSLDDVEKIGSLIFGLITIIILITGYKKFLQNKLRDKQLDIVTELISQIQQEDWHFLTFNNFENLPLEYRIATLFDVAEMNEFEECDNLFFWGLDIELPGEKLLEWEFFNKFHSHPFLPVSIAIQLKKFSLWQQQERISFDEANKYKYIALGRKASITPGAYFFYFPEGNMYSCKEFKKSAKELKDSIINWAEKYGLDDLNVTTSHIHEAKFSEFRK
jgi:hypothetical protein